MRFKAKTSEIKKLFDNALEFSAKKSGMSITGNFLLKADGDQLEVKATDITKGFTSRITVEVSEPGTVAASSEKLKDIMKAVKGYDELDFFTKDNKLSIKNSGTRKFQMNMKTMPAGNFPVMEKDDNVEYFLFPQSDFLAMIDKTVTMVSKDTSRIFLTGCCLTKEGDKLVMVSTDGKRLSKICRAADSTPDFGNSIIPVGFLNSIKNIAPGEGLMQIGITETKMFVKIDETSIYTTLLTGRFPAYNRVIPASFRLSAEIDTKDMKTSLDIIENATSTEESRKAAFEFDDGGCTFSSITDEYDGSYELSVEYEGEPFKIIVSDKLLSSMISKIPDEKFRMEMNTAVSAVRFTWKSDPDAQFILMPMNN